jgi:hypothetical protein
MNKFKMATEAEIDAHDESVDAFAYTPYARLPDISQSILETPPIFPIIIQFEMALKIKKKKNIPKNIRRDVWDFYIGNQYDTPCFCCGKQKMTPFSFECGHVLSEAEGGKALVENLRFTDFFINYKSNRPVCSTCNKSMGKKNMVHFMKDCGYKKNKNWNGKNSISCILM